MAEAGRKRLLDLADGVVASAIADLPTEIRKVATDIPVLLFEDMPENLIEQGWEPDLLGLFEGGDLGVVEGAGQARILLFLRNIMDFAGGDPDLFREEVRVTFLHELGHLLGLDEDDLDKRGLG